MTFVCRPLFFHGNHRFGWYSNAKWTSKDIIYLSCSKSKKPYKILKTIFVTFVLRFSHLWVPWIRLCPLFWSSIFKTHWKLTCKVHAFQKIILIWTKYEHLYLWKSVLKYIRFSFLVKKKHYSKSILQPCTKAQTTNNNPPVMDLILASHMQLW